LSRCVVAISFAVVAHRGALLLQPNTVAGGRRMAKRLRFYGGSDTRHIRLYVGGKTFDMRMEATNFVQYLQALFGDNVKLPWDDAGQVFVGRWPVLFKVLLLNVRLLTRPRRSYILKRKHDRLTECDPSAP
jgi:hypothetical protein